MGLIYLTQKKGYNTHPTTTNNKNQHVQKKPYPPLSYWNLRGRYPFKFQRGNEGKLTITYNLYS